MASSSGRGDFDRFWSIVWLKVGKGDARKAFSAATKKASADEIIEGAVAFQGWLIHEKKQRQFFPHPATWLRAERWADELIFSKPPSPEPAPIWGDSGFDAEASMIEGKLAQKRAYDAVVWLEERDELEVEAAFERVRKSRNMNGVGIFANSTWRQFPVWTAEAMGWCARLD